MRIVSRAIRNVYRNPARSIIVLLVLALSAGISVAMFQATSATSRQTSNLTALLETTIEVRNAGATGMGSGVEQIPEAEVAKIDSAPSAANIVGVEKQVLVRNVYQEYFPTISVTVGNEPGKPLRVATHGEPAAVRIVDGRNFTPDDTGKYVAIIGSGYAETRGLAVGDRFLYQPRPGEEFPGRAREAELEVIGIFESGFSFGNNQIFIPFDTAQRIHGLEDQVTILWVTVDDIDNVDRVEQDLRSVYGGSRDVLSGQQKAEFAARSFDRIVRLGRVGLGLAVALGGLVVLFTMTLTVHERIREIGLFKAIGASNGAVAAQFAVETLVLVVVGGLLGLVVFLTVGPPIVSRILGIDQSAETVSSIEMGLAPATAFLDIDYSITPRNLIFVLGLVLLTALVGSLYPVYRAVRMNPAEALRYE